MEIVQPKKTGSGRSRKAGGKEHPMGMKFFGLRGASRWQVM